MSYFPMYIQLENKNCLILGSNFAAYRKIKILQEFGANIKVIAPHITDKIRETTNILWEERSYELEDFQWADLVVASMGDVNLNHEISLLCQENKIPINAIDQMKDCTFIFPSYIKRGEVVASFSSGGTSPVITQYLRREAETIVTPKLGEIAECLGKLRAIVKEYVSTENARKKVYEEILQRSLEENRILSEEELSQIIERYSL